MTASVALSTEGLPEKETAPAWHDWMAQLFSGLDTDLYGDTRFDGRINVAYAGDVMLTKLEAGRHRVIRDSHRLRDSEMAYLKIVAPWDGHAQAAKRAASLRQQRRLGDLRHFAGLRGCQPCAYRAPDSDGAQAKHC